MPVGQRDKHEGRPGERAHRMSNRQVGHSGRRRDNGRVDQPAIT
jgi:hypothetical protein